MGYARRPIVTGVPVLRFVWSSGRIHCTYGKMLSKQLDQVQLFYLLASNNFKQLQVTNNR